MNLEHKIDSLIASLYAETVSYQKEMEQYTYDDQTRRSYHKEIAICKVEIETRKNIIKRLQALVDE